MTAHAHTTNEAVSAAVSGEFLITRSRSAKQRYGQSGKVTKSRNIAEHLRLKNEPGVVAAYTGLHPNPPYRYIAAYLGCAPSRSLGVIDTARLPRHERTRSLLEASTTVLCQMPDRIRQGAARDFQLLVGDNAMVPKYLRLSVVHAVPTTSPAEVIRFYAEAFRSVFQFTGVVSDGVDPSIELTCHMKAKHASVSLAPSADGSHVEFRVAFGYCHPLLEHFSSLIPEAEPGVLMLEPAVHALARSLAPYFHALWKVQVRASLPIEALVGQDPADDFRSRVGGVTRRADTRPKLAPLLRRLTRERVVPIADERVPALSGFAERQFDALARDGIELTCRIPGSDVGSRHYARLRDPFLLLTERAQGREALEAALAQAESAGSPGTCPCGDPVRAEHAVVRHTYLLPDGRRASFVGRRAAHVGHAKFEFAVDGEEAVLLHAICPVFPTEDGTPDRDGLPLADPASFERAVCLMLGGTKLSIPQMDRVLAQACSARLLRRVYRDSRSKRRRGRSQAATSASGHHLLEDRLYLTLAGLVLEGRASVRDDLYWVGEEPEEQSDDVEPDDVESVDDDAVEDTQDPEEAE